VHGGGGVRPPGREMPREREKERERVEGTFIVGSPPVDKVGRGGKVKPLSELLTGDWL